MSKTKTDAFTRRVTYKGYHGTTSGSVAYYAEADPRIKKIHEKFMADEVSEDQVRNAVLKIAGHERLRSDWRVLAKAPESWVTGAPAFEEWVRAQPPAYSRIYGSPEVIAGVIIASKESE